MLYLTVGWFQKVLSLEIWWNTVIGIGQQMAFLCQIVSKNGVKQPMENQSLSQCFIQAVFNFEPQLGEFSQAPIMIGWLVHLRSDADAMAILRVEAIQPWRSEVKNGHYITIYPLVI